MQWKSPDKNFEVIVNAKVSADENLLNWTSRQPYEVYEIIWKALTKKIEIFRANNNNPRSEDFQGLKSERTAIAYEWS